MLFIISVLFVFLKLIDTKIMLLISLALYLLVELVDHNLLIGHIIDVMHNSLWFAMGGFVACNYDSIKQKLGNKYVGIICFFALTLLQFVEISAEYAFVLNILKTITGIEMTYVFARFIAEKMSRDNLVYKLAKLIGKYCMDIYLLSMFVLVPLRIVFVNLGVMNYVNYYLYVMFSVVLGVVIPWAVSNYVVRKNKVLSALLIGG